MPVSKKLTDRHIEFSSQIKKHAAFKSGIQALVQIETLSRLQQLEYQDVKFKDFNPDEVCIYCDPPYRGTAEYVDGGFNVKDFDEWFKSLPYSGFLSEYNAPFEKIASFGKLSLLNNNGKTKKTISENLYWNGV